MKKKMKKSIGNFAINLGKNAVGKCMIPGMFDPKIPEIIKGTSTNCGDRRNNYDKIF